MRRSRAGRVLCFQVVLLALLIPFGAYRAAPATESLLPEWIEVDYTELVDLRQPSHSGEPVGTLLRRLAGRERPTGGERPNDYAIHRLIDPLLEPYAFVLSDALDSLSPPRGRFFVEVGSLWQPGEEQPAWVELLRARRYLVESDGGGTLRLFLPWEGEPGSVTASSKAALAAYGAAWPVLRHVLEAERRRLSREAEPPPELQVQAYAYRHLPARALFLLGTQPAELVVDDTRPDGTRPPLDLAALRKFLESGLLMEGARIDPSGSLSWLGSQKRERPEILGRPVELSDLAVAYRAVFHGGLAEPYMSLDKSYWPQSSVVNYGGRLRDTALGMVSLLCDARFKTFSQGIDIRTGADLRETVRGRLPAFMTHLEHMAYDERSAQTTTQQTRLWFYPDSVDLTVSAQGDVLVLRKVRMSAASERFEGGSTANASEAPPWTRATVDSINREYDLLATFFPEMGDLDNVVRVLSLFTWLRHVELQGLRVPDLDPLLNVVLPQLPTPRTFPQLLAFNALPQPGSDGKVDVIERLEVVEGLDRLNPSSGRPLPAADRFRRMVAALDSSNAEQAALLQRLAGVDPATVSEASLDAAAYQAQRLMMHDLVLTTLRGESRDQVAGRFRRGEKLRVFSVGIGGLDLGMEKVLARAEGGRLELGTAGFGSGATLHGSLAAGTALGAGSASPAVEEPRPEWRVDPPGLQPTSLPRHGFGGERPSPGSLLRVGGNRFEVGPAAGKKNRPAWMLAVYGEDSPEVRSRRLVRDPDGGGRLFERLEQMRMLRYRMERREARVTARRETVGAPIRPEKLDEIAIPIGLALMRINGVAEQSDSMTVSVRLEASPLGVRRGLDASYPRQQLRRLVLGPAADKTPERPMGGLEPMPESLGQVETLMVLTRPGQGRAPWLGEPLALPGEENPIRLAAALDDWWIAGEGKSPRAVVGVDPVDSARRWATAQRPGSDALLLLPEASFSGGNEKLEQELRRAWGSGEVATRLPEGLESSLVVWIAAEAPGLFARRLRELAANPALEGKLLAAWNLNGSVREDLPSSLLAETGLAGLGLVDASIVEARAITARLADMRAALENGGQSAARVEQLPGPFLWYF